MADIGQTNTYDPEVSWHFHEGYYVFNNGISVKECQYLSNKDRIFTNYRYVETYSFRRDEFGDNTYELVLDFASNFGYEVVNSDNVIVVLAEECQPRYDLSTWSSNPDCLTGEIFFDKETFIDQIKSYAEYAYNSNKLPGKNYFWEGEVNVEPTPEPTTTPDPSGDDPGTEIDNGDHIDIDTIDDESEILREIYKQDTGYYRDLLEVQQNAFDFQVVHVSLMFCSVFLCGILVGCAFARSLWHKMNAG